MAHRDPSPPLVKQEADDADSDAHYHHRKHRHTHDQQTLTSPSGSAQHSLSNNGHTNHSSTNHQTATSAASQAQWNSHSSIQPITKFDPLQVEVETLRKQNMQLQAEVAALQEKLKATSIHSSPSTSPLPIQHPPPPQHAPTPPTNTLSPSSLHYRSATPEPPATLTSPPTQTPPPITPVKEEVEVTQTANVDGRSSCHRCKSQKDNQQLMFCTYRGDDGKRTKICRKKYCKNCLLRWHLPSDKPAAGGTTASGTGAAAAAGQSGSPVSSGASCVAVNGAVVGMGDEYEWWQPNNRLGWCCPACLGCCKCAACQRKYQWDVHVTSTAAAAGTAGGEDELRKDVMERLQEQAVSRFRTLKATGALQRSPVPTTKERKIKPAPVLPSPPTPMQANQSPTLSSEHDGHDRESIPSYALPSPSPALSVHSRSESSTSLSSLMSHPLTADQTRQLLLNLKQGTLNPSQVAQLQLTLESQLQQMGGGGGLQYGSSDEEKGSPTHSPYPESERDSPQSRASLQSYQSHGTTHSAQSGHSSHPYYHSLGALHGHSQSAPPHSQQPYHVAAISIPQSLQPQPPGLISPLSSSGYEQGQYGYGPAPGSGGGDPQPHKRSDSRGPGGRKRSSGSSHDYVPAVTAHAVSAVPAYHPPPSHLSQQATYVAQPPSPVFAYPPTTATVHASHQYQQQQSTSGYSSQQQSQQPYSAAQPSHSPQQSYARVPSPHTSHPQHPQHGTTQPQVHGGSTANSAYSRENRTQAMHNMREHVLASRQPARSPSAAASVSPAASSYQPPASPTGYVGEPYYLQSPVASIPFPQLSNSYSVNLPTSPYPPHHSDGEVDPLNEWPLSPGGVPGLRTLGSVEEGDVVTMMNESSVGGSGRGLGVGDDMQLSGMSLGAAGTMPLSLRADTFTPPTLD